MEDAHTQLNKQLEKNINLHIVLENQIQQMEYGQMTLTVQLSNGTAQMTTLNLVKQKRKKY